MSKSNWTLQECLEREKFYAEGEKKMGIHGYHSNLYDYLNMLYQARLIMTGIYCVGDITKEKGMQQLVECLKEKTAQELDKIYVALNLEYDNKNKDFNNNNVKQLQKAMINCIDCKFYEHDEEFILSYCSLDGEGVIDASKYGCEVGEQKKEQKP